MKLDLVAAIALSFAFACCAGCAGNGSTARGPANQAGLDQHVATTQLMSAQLGGTPKVGKSHLAAADEEGENDASSSGEELGARLVPKEVRREDGTRRGGHFGTSK